MFKSKCQHCKYFAKNQETYPFCIACAYCRRRKHILHVHLDGTLPVFCHICHPKKWKDEFDAKTIKILEKVSSKKNS